MGRRNKIEDEDTAEYAPVEGVLSDPVGDAKIAIWKAAAVAAWALAAACIVIAAVVFSWGWSIVVG
jgi:hypothetical protein